MRNTGKDTRSQLALKFTAMLLALVMVVGMLPAAAMADEDAPSDGTSSETVKTEEVCASDETDDTEAAEETEESGDAEETAETEKTLISDAQATDSAGNSSTQSDDTSGDSDAQEDSDDTDTQETVTDLSDAAVTLSSTSYTYSGSAKKPTVTVKISGTTLTKNTDYTVSYSKNTSIGTASVKITGKGNYSGTASKTFTIKPGKVTLKSAKSSAKTKLTVKWKKCSGSVKYQIAYRLKSSSSWTYKTVSSSTLTKTLTGLKNGRKYVVKVRAYKKVSGKTYYGSWSSTKTAQVKGTAAVSKVKLSSSSVSLVVGCTKKLTATVTPEEAVKKTVTWSSSKPSVATVSSSGKITAKKAGTTTITAKTANGKKATCKVTVKSSGYISTSSAYTLLNEFRTTSGVWYWNSDNSTKTYFNKSGYTTLSSLKKSSELEAVAKTRAKELATSFSHTRPDGTSCFTAYPSSASALGENIACGYTSCSSVIEAWKETSSKYSGQGHRRNMLSTSYNAVGIACYKKNGVCYWVMALGYL